VVSIHRDECCVKKRGYCFMPLEDRRAVIEAIKYVDEVIVCGENCDLTTCECKSLNLTFLQKEEIEPRTICPKAKLNYARS